MIVNGIIAEYNPFHNGHLHQLETSKQITGADYTIVVMSGNFVQRGTPALTDKHTRAEMALRNGADLVLELPAFYATSSAEYFAMGGVSLLDKLGVVNHLCFGSECGDINSLYEIATLLSNESEEYSATIKDCLTRGYSYPTARNMALLMHYPHLNQCSDVLSSPNNILGIEYCKAILSRNSKIRPMTIKRADAGYHSTDTANHLCSATAIRKVLFKENQNFKNITGHLPEDTLQILEDKAKNSKLIEANDFSTILYYKLLFDKETGYEKYLDVSNELSDRIKNNLYAFENFESFCDILKTKEITHTRISRSLMHILLNITKEDMLWGKSIDYVPYARVLGFRKDSTKLLSTIKEHSSIPLITKVADAEKLLDENAYLLLKKDIWVSDLYQSVFLNKPRTSNEFTTPIVII